MEEKKKKKISIKNKKVVKNTLASASIKGKTIQKKASTKNSSIKKKTTKPVVKKETKIIEKKERVVKEPNNIKRKIVKKEEKKPVKKKKEEEKSFTTRIEFPKEWKTINSKNSKTKKNVVDKPKTIKGKLRNSIFESIDENEFKERKKKEKESLKKFLLIALIVIASITLILIILVKYNDYVRRKLAVYSTYRIGDVVYLDDDSLWYVVSDSDASKEYVKLLSDKVIDINGDGVIDANDTVMYNSENKAEYDTKNENSAAYILNDSIKYKYEDKIGSIKEISLLTVNEYVKIRERMNYGDEWSEGNWLASYENQKWWILSEKNDKVYVVSSKGTFYLSNAKNSHFVRPTILVEKRLVNKVEEKKEVTLDLTNGLE